tara:strand:+ start:6870 stop:7079 length:210 start_codon:yes stop_codon:yes gene_type:complete
MDLHPREYLLGRAKLLQQRGQPIPLDMLAEADRLGLSLELFNEPVEPPEEDNANFQEGDILNGTEEDYV